MRRRLRELLFFFSIATMFGMFATDLMAADIEFHGFLESNLVLRDEDGVQYGFLDHLNAVQQRNTLKFDVDITPNLAWGELSFKKVHLTYRGAYDSIFDLRAHQFGDISEKGGPTRFDYGLRDIRFENDLREATIDFVYSGSLGSAFFRPGRQIVSWGESSPAVTLLDVINPPDNSYQLFFQNPDDVKIPLWMGRLNYSVPEFMPGFTMNFDFLWIPDIRPAQFGPRDAAAVDPKTGAPYSGILFSGLQPFTVREEVPTEKQEYGVKLTTLIGERLSVSALYFHDVISDPGVVLTNFTILPGIGPVPTTALFTHDTRNVLGGYFSYQFEPLDVIIRGEYSHYTAAPVGVPGSRLTPFVDIDLDPTGSPTALRTFRMHPVNKFMLAFDKNYMVKWLAPHQNTFFSVEWDRTQIASWDSTFDAPDSTVARIQDVFLLVTSWSWFQGKIVPTFVAAYIPGGNGDGGGTGMIHPIVNWNISGNLYAATALQAFFGDKEAVKSGFAGFINGTSELTFKIVYEW